MKLSTGIKASVTLKLCLLLWLLPACGSNKNKTTSEKLPTAAGIYSSESFTEKILDSSTIISFFKSFPATDSIKKEVQQFYQRRSYQFAWVSENGLTSAALNFYQQMKSDSRDFADKTLMNAPLDTLYDELKQNEKSFLSKKDLIERLELLLTTSFFKYATKIYGGITTESKGLEWYIPRKKKNYNVLLDSLVVLSPGKTLEEPVNEYYIRLKEKLKIFREIQKQGGLPVMVTRKTLFISGDNDSCLVQAKQHLFLTGDLKYNDHTFLFNDSLVSAVKNYQKRMGLAITGKIDLGTITEMNKSIDIRIMQIMVNMERLRWAPVEMEKNYLLVNIPEFKLHVFENNRQVWITSVVVGKAVRQTSIFRDNVSQIILNPYWNVPPSITRKEILPHLKRNAAYLKNNNMEVVSQNPFVVRQKPGPGNALGRVKFLFPNNYNIYLHDTPAKNLFGETKRAFSHGCIRVEDPFWLARYLLRKDPSWTAEKMDAIVAAGKEFPISISPAVPVYITYFTAWVDNTGQINFRNDIYGLDKKLASEIFGK